METQTLSLRYIDKAVIAQTLTALFGENNFNVDIRDDNHAVLIVPRRLTEAEIIKLQEDLQNASN